MPDEMRAAWDHREEGAASRREWQQLFDAL